MSDVLKESRHSDMHRIGPSCPNDFAAKPSRTVPAKSEGRFLLPLFAAPKPASAQQQPQIVVDFVTKPPACHTGGRG
jgi:hypothetical protein